MAIQHEVLATPGEAPDVVALTLIRAALRRTRLAASRIAPSKSPQWMPRTDTRAQDLD
ncbi:MAG TPA: hypothetical protein VHM48_11125 [Candidatus Limnocylindrales bacterium]|nr:hypothetical protein [Candidatus Limnocylindrales bacterium]